MDVQQAKADLLAALESCQRQAAQLAAAAGEAADREAMADASEYIGLAIRATNDVEGGRAIIV